MFTLCQLNPFQYEAIVQSVRTGARTLAGVKQRYGRDSQSFLRVALLVAQVYTTLGRESAIGGRITETLGEYPGSIVDDAVESGKVLFAEGKAGIGVLVDAVVIKCGSLLADDADAQSIAQAQTLLKETLDKAEGAMKTTSFEIRIFLTYGSIQHSPDQRRDLCRCYTI
jgi:hypothetical protein